jgi:hypothetical protein
MEFTLASPIIIPSRSASPYIPRTPSPSPSESLALPIPPPPPASPFSYLEHLIDEGELNAPGPLLTALAAYRKKIRPNVMQKVEYAALQSAVAHRTRTNDRANAVNDYAQRVLDESARQDVSNQQILAILRERVAELEKETDKSGECPVGYEENCGRAPNFRITDDDGNGRVARYIKRIPGSGQIAGTLGGYNDEAYLSDLVAEPRF